MRRIAWMVFRLLWYVPYVFVRLAYVGSKKHYEEEKAFRSVRAMCARAAKAGRVTIKANGQENLPEEPGFVVFPNHQGAFDALLFMLTMNQPFRVISKKENANIILVKQVMKALRAKSMDREDIRQSMKVIMEVTKEVREGHNYIIFPEGTRCRVKNSLEPFKGGTFKTATGAQAPIIPAAVFGSHDVFDSKDTKPIQVQVSYLKPILPEEYQGRKTTEIAAMVEERVKEELERLSGESWTIRKEKA